MAYIPVSTSMPLPQMNPMAGGGATVVPSTNNQIPGVQVNQQQQQTNTLPTATFQPIRTSTTAPPQTFNAALPNRSSVTPALGRGQPPPRLPFSLSNQQSTSATANATQPQASGYYTPKPPEYAPYTFEDQENQKMPGEIEPLAAANDAGAWRPSPRDSLLRFRSVSGPNVHFNTPLQPVREAGMGGATVSKNWQKEIVTMPGGKLSLELPMPSSIEIQHPSHFQAPLSTYPHFDSVRYSCITHDPDLLKMRGWDLRQRPIPNPSWRHQPNQFVPNASGLWESRPMIDGSTKSLWDDGRALADEAGEGGDRPRIEMCICITVYNERADHFVRTLDAIFRNLDYLCHSRSLGRTRVQRIHDALHKATKSGLREDVDSNREKVSWRARGEQAKRAWFHPRAWQKIVVIIVIDGIEHADPRVLDNLETMGIYQPSALKETDEFGREYLRKGVAGEQVQAHLFEATITRPSPDFRARQEKKEPPIVPIQTILCLKPKNQKKINSHRWFFSLCSILQPRITVMLDVGTAPEKDALYHLWKPLYMFNNVAGTCGEIKPSKGIAYSDLIRNPLIAAQNFEYKVSNLLDKRLESSLGFVSVLPGAFSAYRYSSLLNDPKTGLGPLHSYYLGEPGERQQSLAGIDHFAKQRTVNPVVRRKLSRKGLTSLFSRNMYLAEDRILAFELVSKPESKNTLYYAHRAIAEVDPVDNLQEFILQRRRWLNGSFFTSWHSIIFFFQIYRTKHGFFRMIILHLQWFYNLFTLFFAWLTPANFFITFSFIGQALQDNVNQMKGWAGDDIQGSYPGIRIPVMTAQYVYVGILLATLVLSLGNKPNGVASQWLFKTASFFYAILAAFMIGVMIYLVYVAFDNVAKAPGGISFSSLINSCSITEIFLAVAGTYGTWIISALLALQPYHLATSLLQYLLLSPTYINILNIYAFANISDVSWGTKNSLDIPDEKALGENPETEREKVVNTYRAQVSLPRAEQLEASYQQAEGRLRQQVFMSTRREKKIEKEGLTDSERRAYENARTLDYYSSFRTALIMVWGSTNVFLVVVVLSIQSGENLWTGAITNRDTGVCSTSGTTYMSFLLYSILALSAVKLIGAIYYRLESALIH